jgi:hypothetical protein
MKDYQIRTTRIHILPKDEPLFSVFGTIIEIDDEAAGEYLTVTQQGDTDDAMNQQICIEPENWTLLKQGIEMMLGEIEKHQKEVQP